MDLLDTLLEKRPILTAVPVAENTHSVSLKGGGRERRERGGEEEEEEEEEEERETERERERDTYTCRNR